MLNRRVPACWTVCTAILGLFLLPEVLGVSHSFAEGTDVFHQDSSPAQDSAEAHLRLGIDFFLMNELDVAIDEFREAAHQRPGYADAYHNLGVAQAKTGDLTGALAAWSQAERLDIQTVSLRYHLSALVSYNYGISLVRDGRLAQAMAQWRAALRIQPDFSEAHYALGLGYLAAGDPVPAVAHFQETLHEASHWAHAYEALGLAYYASHEYVLAEQAWRQALALEPDLSTVHANLGLLQLQEGNYQEAIRHSRNALTLQPDLVAAHYNVGVALFAKGDESASVPSLEMALSLDPRLTSARLLLGVVWSRMGNWAQAASLWGEALRQDPSGKDGVWLHHNLGVALAAMGLVDEAVAEFGVVASQRPEWAPGWSQLGSALMATRQWEKAVDALETAARLQPAWAHLHFAIGKAYAESGKLSQAVAAFQRAVELEPRFVDAWFHLGVVLRAQNRSREAVEPLRLAAEGGSGEAQSLLASMYANGSGVDRNVSLAMLWWFRSSHASMADSLTQTAKEQLSQFRRGLHRHLFSPNDRQEVLTGFGLIREDLYRSAPLHRVSTQVGNEEVTWDHVTPTEPVVAWVIDHALAGDQSAQHKLHAWYVNGERGRLVPADHQIRNYFLQTANEGDPFSCQVVRTIATDSSDLFIADWQLAAKGCLDETIIPGL
ncbi:MAG: tetratricopeptide repeat protein [Nitrospirota bacterium]|nr:tetratricopeptide repeat protein [Nitrospirota bacterium]MDH5700620.1 tetratricopeptide repeat protein [Nitrospirota bacterium]